MLFSAVHQRPSTPITLSNPQSIHPSQPLNLSSLPTTIPDVPGVPGSTLCSHTPLSPPLSSTANSPNLPPALPNLCAKRGQSWVTVAKTPTTTNHTHNNHSLFLLLLLLFFLLFPHLFSPPSLDSLGYSTSTPCSTLPSWSRRSLSFFITLLCITSVSGLLRSPRSIATTWIDSSSTIHLNYRSRPLPPRRQSLALPVQSKQNRKSIEIPLLAQ